MRDDVYASKRAFSGEMVSKALQLLFIVGCAAVLTACSSTPDCMKPQSYMNAKSFPSLKNPAGLDVPASDPNMQIPQVACAVCKAYQHDYDCLGYAQPEACKQC